MTLGQKYHYPVHPLKKKIRTVTNKATSHGKKSLLDQVFSLRSLKMTIHFFPTSQTLSPDAHMWIPLKSKRPQNPFEVSSWWQESRTRYAPEQERESVCVCVCARVCVCVGVGVWDVRVHACILAPAHMRTGVEASYRSQKPISESSSFKSSQRDYPGNPLTSMIQYMSKGDGKVLWTTSAKFIKP